MKKTKKIFIVFSILLLPLLSCTKQVKPEVSLEQSSIHNNMVVLSEQEKFLANISVDTARIKPLSEINTLTGRVVIDENNVRVVSSRVRGRIEKLYVRNPGELVSTGVPLYDLYSEELLSDQQDYLLALSQVRMAQTQKEFAQIVADAARKKLLSWTFTNEQIEALEKRGQASAYSTFYSNSTGYVVELSVREGQYVEAGAPIVKLSDLDTVWVEAQVYSNELTSFREKSHLTVETDAIPGKIFDGQVVFNNPFLEANKKINLLRIAVSNTTGDLKPGMIAYVNLKGNGKTALVIPKSSLLIENIVSVWVQIPDGMYEQRMVTTGIENKLEVEILSGLKVGELVVTRGAFLLKSARVVRQGGNSMEGMKM